MTEIIFSDIGDQFYAGRNAPDWNKLLSIMLTLAVPEES